MKNIGPFSWALIVGLLYILIAQALMAPLAGVLFAKNFNLLESIHAASQDKLFSFKYTWFVLLILFISQMAFLAVPVRVGQKKPVTKSSIIPVAIAASLAIAILFSGAAFSLMEAWSLAGKMPNMYTRGDVNLILIIIGLLWILWARLFYIWSKNDTPQSFIDKQCRVLFKGSILELLIAVPCHIFVRHRQECCAGIQTGVGIALGLAVMLLSFGPGLFFLFKARVEQIKKT